MLPGMIPTMFLGISLVPKLSFISSAQSTSSSSSYSFSSMSIGPARSDRVVIVCVGADAGSGSGTISSVTIGGITATQIVSAASGTSGHSTAGIYAALVPTGTTATIVVNVSNSYSRCTVVVYTMTGTGGKFTATNTSTATNSTSLSISGLTGKVNGCALAVADCANSGGTSVSVTQGGLAEDFNSAYSGVSYSRVATQSKNNCAPAIPTLTAAAASANSQREVLCAATFGPY